jgi:hypothetical protein
MQSACLKDMINTRAGVPSLRSRLVALSVLLAAGAGACDNKVTPVDNLGEVRLAVVLPSGDEIHAVDWVIHSSTGSVVIQGTINTTNAKSSPGLVAALPAGNGDTLTMSATTTEGVGCTGTSAPFNVVAGATATVNVNILCSSIVSDAGTGTIIAHGTVVAGDSCPVLTSSLISPQQTAIADPVAVTAAASDSDMGDTLTYAWTATAGTFTNASLASTQYHCSATAGMHTLTVTITDNHAPTPCATVVNFPPVDCQ